MQIARSALYGVRVMVPLARRAILVCALIAAGAQFPTAQGPPPGARGGQATPAPAPADPTEAAFNRGQYDEIERLFGSRSDNRSVTWRARALVARGRYAEAERVLAPAAAAAPDSDAALELGRLQLLLGRRDEGRQTLRRILDGSEPRTVDGLVRAGKAAAALRQFQDANASFRTAHRLAPTDPHVNTPWGEMFLEGHDNANAAKSFQDTLAVDATNVAAIVGMARAVLDTDPPAARAAAEHALTINASYEPAHMLAAEIALDERRRADAEQSLQKALAVNPNSLDARALDAALAFLDGRLDEFDAKASAVKSINPTSGEVYRVAGETAARNYRFDEAVVLTKRALAIDPDDTRAYADLGMHLLRTGDEPGARQALERAFKDDDLDTVTYNLLAMLDTLDTFVTVQDGDLTVRLAPDEAAVMREQVVPFAKEALASLSKEWNFTPSGPILVEMFPKHDDFAVRTVGLPGMLGALGACFGRVVTLDSPHARPPGDYSWQPTLWHELAHVITLQMSKNRVPRWLTEGISVWEERRARPEWGREMEVAFAQALNDDRVLKVKVLNEGFSDPKMISLAYYEASLLVEHLAATYGQPAISKVLRAYGRGLDTDAALKEGLGVTIDDIQASFDARLTQQYAGLRLALKQPDIKDKPTLEKLAELAAAQPGSFPLQMSLGDARLDAGDQAGAIKAFEAAARLVPAATGENNPNKLIAKIAMDQGDQPRAIRALEAVVRVDYADVESARALIKLVEPLGDAARTEDAYARLAAVDPFDAAAQNALGEFALRRKDAPAAIRAFRTALAARVADRPTAHVNVAEAYMLAGKPAEAKKEVLAALEVAPSFERAQDLLLKIAATGN